MKTIEKEKLSFDVVTSDNAPQASKNALINAEKKYGFAANIFGVMANHPGLLNAYFASNSELITHSVFTPREREIAFLAVSYENDCNYCMSSHSAVAHMLHIDNSIVNALRNGTEIPDTKLQALANFVKTTTKNRGKVSLADTLSFIEAGYPQEVVLEVILIISLKTITNYTDHLTNIEIDNVFNATKWDANNK